MFASRYVASIALSALAFAAGCQPATSRGSMNQPQPVQATARVDEPAPAPAAVPPAPMFEQALDTQVGPTAQAAPVLTTHHRKTSKVRTVPDEQLPKWVPVKGRLTVVDSTDLAENLGLVPKGTTRKSDERISVADKLAEESATRAKSDPMTQGTSWSYAKAGRFRSRR